MLETQQNEKFKLSNFRLPDSVELHVRRWLPGHAPRAVVQIAHGLTEHSGRYERLATTLAATGYAVYAGDHRGHGLTAPSRAALGYFADRDGWDKCVDDLWQLNRLIATEQPGLPITLFGHSMGSFMAQHFIALHGDALAGTILSGSGGKPPAILHLARLIAYIERRRLGGHSHSQFLTTFAFCALNRALPFVRTTCDWLNRAPDEADRCMADPLCIFPQSVQMSLDICDGIVKATSPELQARIPKTLPVYIIAGSLDPVSNGTKTLRQLLRAYRAAGLEHVAHKFYPGARHELFHETNRDEVTGDVLAWLGGLER